MFEGSPQFTGKIPTYDMTDAQVSYSISKWKTICKLGVSNLFGIVPVVSEWKNGLGEALKAGFDNRQFQVYGGPRIGRLAYFSVTVNID